MGKCLLSRAALFGAAFFVSAAGAGWEVYYESGAISLSGLDCKAWPAGYCLGYEAPLGGSGGPD
ncbi:MAG TPA: hypothetical protein VMX79_12715 [bacterium]|nr:hypothetical protein [bacterium]